MNDTFGSIVILNSCLVQDHKTTKSILPLIKNKRFIAALFFIEQKGLEHGCLYDDSEKCEYKGVVRCKICKEILLNRSDMRTMKGISRLGGPIGIKHFLREKGFMEYFPENL